MTQSPSVKIGWRKKRGLVVTQDTVPMLVFSTVVTFSIHWSKVPDEAQGIGTGTAQVGGAASH